MPHLQHCCSTIACHLTRIPSCKERHQRQIKRTSRRSPQSMQHRTPCESSFNCVCIYPNRRQFLFPARVSISRISGRGNRPLSLPWNSTGRRPSNAAAFAPILDRCRWGLEYCVNDSSKLPFTQFACPRHQSSKPSLVDPQSRIDPLTG